MHTQRIAGLAGRETPEKTNDKIESAFAVNIVRRVGPKRRMWYISLLAAPANEKESESQPAF